MKHALVFFGAIGLSFSVWATAPDLGSIEKELTGTGVQGWMHGTAGDFQQYVFTYRDPSDFFSHLEFSLLPNNPTAEAILKMTNRHDLVRIQGKFSSGSSAQKHVIVDKITILTPYKSGITVPARTREAKLPADLKAANTLLATVHAIAADGEVLVVEYKDAVVPVFVKDKTLSKDLYRGDKIRLHYTVLPGPKLPTHLLLDTKAVPAIEVLDRMVDQHGKDLVLEGSLVYFPKSPQIRFGIFALQVVDSNGLKRNYTLVNFEDTDVFMAILEKLEKTWKAQIATAEDGRNCYVNPKIQVRATGVGNVVSPNQANPQILLDGPDSVEFPALP